MTAPSAVDSTVWGRAICPYASGVALTHRTRLLFALHITAVRRGRPDVALIQCDTGKQHGPWPE